MAVRAHTEGQPSATSGQDLAYGLEMPHTAVWTGVTENDTGEAIQIDGDVVDMAFQVTGTFGGATGILQGSDDGGTTWHTLTDITGAAIAKTTAGRADVASRALLYRPVPSGGSSTILAFQLTWRLAYPSVARNV